MVSATGWPTPWVGTWIAEDAKRVSVSRGPHGVTVTARPGPRRPPYVSAELPGGGTKLIEDLPAGCAVATLDKRSCRYLEVEAGTPGLGPTYRLYAVVEHTAGLRSAADDTPVDRVVLMPQVVCGVYDDYEDDLGVPWAFPLNPLRWPLS